MANPTSVSDFASPSFDPAAYVSTLTSKLSEQSAVSEFELRKKINQLKTLRSKVSHKIHETLFTNYSKIIRVDENIEELKETLRVGEKHEVIFRAGLKDVDDVVAEVRQSMNLVALEAEEVKTKKAEEARAARETEAQRAEELEIMNKVDQCLQRNDAVEASKLFLLYAQRTTDCESVCLSTGTNEKCLLILKTLEMMLFRTAMENRDEIDHPLVLMYRLSLYRSAERSQPYGFDYLSVFTRFLQVQKELLTRKYLLKDSTTQNWLLLTESLLSDLEELMIVLAAVLSECDDRPVRSTIAVLNSNNSRHNVFAETFLCFDDLLNQYCDRSVCHFFAPIDTVQVTDGRLCLLVEQDIRTLFTPSLGTSGEAVGTVLTAFATDSCATRAAAVYEWLTKSTLLMQNFAQVLTLIASFDGRIQSTSLELNLFQKLFGRALQVFKVAIISTFVTAKAKILDGCSEIEQLSTATSAALQQNNSVYKTTLRHCVLVFTPFYKQSLLKRSGQQKDCLYLQGLATQCLVQLCVIYTYQTIAAVKGNEVSDMLNVLCAIDLAHVETERALSQGEQPGQQQLRNELFRAEELLQPFVSDIAARLSQTYFEEIFCPSRAGSAGEGSRTATTAGFLIVSEKLSALYHRYSSATQRESIPDPREPTWLRVRTEVFSELLAQVVEALCRSLASASVFKAEVLTKNFHFLCDHVKDLCDP